ncbi:MAG: hypothetical protein HRU70_08630 [Phycisphaeraceae bacterium]|nr:MAG: hypothetical protein HRU70_08630 [Phycisphaeraceae bacterium]
MPMCPSLTTLAVGVVASLATAPAAATGESHPAKEWLDGLIRQAEQGLGERSIIVHYAAEELKRYDVTEIPHLREKLKRFPEHPDHDKLRRLELFERHGPEVREYTMWYHAGEARLNLEPTPMLPGLYFDVCSTRSGGWRMSPRQLFLTGAPGTEPPSHNPRQSIAASSNEILSFFGAGWSMLPRFKDGYEFRAGQGGTWEATITFRVNDRVTRGRLRGTFEPASGRGRITESLAESADTPASAWRETADEWAHDPVLGAEIARVVVLGMDGKPFRRLMFRRAEPLSEARFREVAATPMLTGRDPIRGEYTFTQVTDMTGAETRYTTYDPEAGTMTHRSEGQTPRGQRQSRLTYAGWVLAAVIASTIVILRVRASRAT